MAPDYIDRTFYSINLVLASLAGQPSAARFTKPAGNATSHEQHKENAMAEDGINSFMKGPDEQGRFGIFGGR